MMAALRYIAAFLSAIAGLAVLTTLSALVLILAGFRGNAQFPVECGLVFGAAISGRNTPGPAIVRRVDGAAELWKSGLVQTLVLSGGKGDSWRLSEAAVMRQHAIRLGVDGRSIYAEDAARSTKENLANSKHIVESRCDSVVAISDQYHLARIRLLAKRAGWGSLQTYGVPERPAHGEAWSVMRELAAYLYYALGADAYMRFDEYDDARSVDGAGSGYSIYTP